MRSLDDSSSAVAKSIRAGELFKLLFATALTTFSGIVVIGDMVPAILFGWIVMLRYDGLQSCTRVDLGLIHQFVTVLATIKER